MMEFESFCQRLLRLLEVEAPAHLNPSTSLYDDPGLDSIQALEIVVVIESLADLVEPPIEMREIYTLQDAYGYYEDCINMAHESEL